MWKSGLGRHISMKRMTNSGGEKKFYIIALYEMISSRYYQVDIIMFEGSSCEMRA